MSLSTSGTSFTAPASIGLTATASDSGGSVSQVAFYNGTTLLSTDTSSPYSYTWSSVPAGTYAITARATDNLGATSTSAPVTVTVAPAGGGGGGSATATFVSTDSTTQGSWKGARGLEGYSLAADGTALPAYALMTLTGQAEYTWTPSTSELRALQRAGSSARFASTWYAATTFTLDVALTGGAHRVGLYMVDWDARGRSQTIEVLDAATNTVLDTRTASSFSNGQYLTWQIAGHVKFRVTGITAANAVVSGIFFDASGAPSNTPPTVSLSTSGTSFTAPASIGLTAAASDSGGSVSQVAFYNGTTLLSTDTSSPYSYTWSSVPAGTYAITARATDNLGATSTSTPVTVTVAPAGGGGGGSATATFVSTDSTSQGNWKGARGVQGYSLAGDATALPAYALVNLTGQAEYTWTASTSELRALQRAGSSARFAATWYGETTFTLDVAVTGGAHRVGLVHGRLGTEKS